MVGFIHIDNKTQCLELSINLSKNIKENYGVPQGFILGPVLF